MARGPACTPAGTPSGAPAVRPDMGGLPSCSVSTCKFSLRPRQVTACGGALVRHLHGTSALEARPPPPGATQPIGSAECPVGLPPVEPQYFRSRPPPPGPGGLGPHRGLEPAHCPSGWSCLAWALVESLGDSSRATLSALWHLGDRCRGLGARASAQGCLCPPQGPGPPGRRQKARGTAPGRLGRAIFSVAAPAPFVTQTVQGPTRTRCLDPGGRLLAFRAP